MNAPPDYPKLRATAFQLRQDIIRMIGAAASGHPGGSLSSADIVAYLYFHQMRIDPKHPQWEERDRFVLSKGHCAPVWYAALANRGYLPREELLTLRDIESRLQGHPDMVKTPGVDMTTGSLGQGFACATGIALGGKVQRKDFRVYLVLSDGELQEGIIWEAAMAAAHYGLGNITAFVDNNKLQTDGFTAEIMSPNPIADKFQAFGWETCEIDGHDLEQIHAATQRTLESKDTPSIIVAQTIKGRGLPSLENQVGSHSLGGAWSAEETEAYLAELETAAQ